MSLLRGPTRRTLKFLLHIMITPSRIISDSSPIFAGGYTSFLLVHVIVAWHFAGHIERYFHLRRPLTYKYIVVHIVISQIRFEPMIIVAPKMLSTLSSVTIANDMDCYFTVPFVELIPTKWGVLSQHMVQQHAQKMWKYCIYW